MATVHHCLKLANEDKNNSMSLRPPKASRRNLSLPNLDSFNLFILKEALSEANDMGMTVEETDIHVQRKSVSFPLNRDISLDHIAEVEMEETEDSSGKDVKLTLLSDETLKEIDDGMNCNHREDTHEPALEDGSFPQEDGGYVRGEESDGEWWPSRSVALKGFFPPLRLQFLLHRRRFLSRFPLLRLRYFFG